MMWTKTTATKNYNLLKAQLYMSNVYPDEVHGLGGHCMNPKCDYSFTPQDIDEMERDGGWFECPKCGWTYNYLEQADFKPGGHTRSGLTLSQMGDIGENIIERMGTIPGVGTVTQMFTDQTKYPIDAIIGSYGVEIKTNHSEAQPRFKLTGGGARTRLQAVDAATQFCQQNNLIPAMIGVRLNFYTDKADIFFRQGFADTWIASGNLDHIATVDFSELNPFPNPEDVPPPSSLPDDDEIPF